jgi:hypothetical protein
MLQPTDEDDDKSYQEQSAWFADLQQTQQQAERWQQ